MARARTSEPGSDEDLLVLPLDFELEREGRTMRRFLIGLVALTAFAILVLALAPIQETAAAPGEIRSSGDLVQIQHPEGGAVDQVLAHRGAVVRPGDPILRLRPIGAESDLDRLAIRRATLSLTIERLDALLEGRLPSLPEDPRLGPKAVEDARALYALERAALERRHPPRSAPRRAPPPQPAAEHNALAAHGAEIAALAEQVALRKPLVEKGHAARSTVLGFEAQKAAAESRRAVAAGQRVSAEDAVLEVEEQIAEARASQRAAWSRERAEAAAERAEIERSLAREADRLAQLTVRAPSYGVVHELHAATPGASVPPNGPVATIVPLDGAVIAEVRISPADVGHIRAGDTAKVRVSTFDPEVVGEIAGRVRRISPTAFQDPDGAAYFQAELTLDRTEVPLYGRMQPLSPGMSVQAQILTGEKSALRYLFKPVARALDTAFSER